MNETPASFKRNPTLRLQALLLFKLALRCRAKSITRGHTLQHAVFENNLSQISKLLKSEHPAIFHVDKNELDQNDNTALMLAVKLQNLDALKVLCDGYCAAKLSCHSMLPSPYELACALQHEQILEILLTSSLKLKQYFMELHKEQIFRTIEKLPDFSIDLHFEC